MRTDDAVTRARRKDAGVQTDDAPSQLPSSPDGSEMTIQTDALTGPPTNPISQESQPRHASPIASEEETSVEDLLDSSASENEHQESTSHPADPAIKRGRGRPRGSLNTKTLLAKGLLPPPGPPPEKKRRGRPPKVCSLFTLMCSIWMLMTLNVV